VQHICDVTILLDFTVLEAETYMNSIDLRRFSAANTETRHLTIKIHWTVAGT